MARQQLGTKPPLRQENVTPFDLFMIAVTLLSLVNLVLYIFIRNKLGRFNSQLAIETRSPEANIQTASDALWWDIMDPTTLGMSAEDPLAQQMAGMGFIAIIGYRPHVPV